MSALQQNCTTDAGLAITNARYEVRGLNIDEVNKIANIQIHVFKDATQAAANKQIRGAIKLEGYTITNVLGDYDTYIDTVHATDNVIKRAQQYLLDKENDFSTAIIVA